CEFLAWLAFVPFFLALENSSKTQALVSAYISGVVFWLGTVYWLVHVTLAGMLVIVLYLALYWGVFGFVISWQGVFRRRTSVFFIPAMWVLLEYCRGYALTGFPWSLLAYSQSQTLAVIQFADITGAWGVSFVVMMANAAIYIVLKNIRHGHSGMKAPVVVACCLLLCVYLYGVFRLHPPDRVSGAPGGHIKISVVQGNIPQELKWDRYAQDYIIQRYSALSQGAAGDAPDLIVWPEAAVPVILGQGSAYLGSLQEFVNARRVNLLAGAVTSRNTMFYNSAVLLQPGAGAEIYDKIHLVPFGEYIPLRQVFGFLETIVPIGEAQKGTDYHVFRPDPLNNAPGYAFSALICYEDVFPELSRRMVNKGAQFLVTVTNDAWYQRTAAPYQHFQSSVFRAVENRVWMVRSANTGVSGFIRPDGSVEGLVQDSAGNTIFVGGYLTRDIEIRTRPHTVYTRLGDWFVAAALFIFLLCSLKIRVFPGALRHR
ncbi:MAG: apolipoprotein N-acyltransferase, partial [Candidatus Omnitrophota bacterium]